MSVDLGKTTASSSKAKAAAAAAASASGAETAVEDEGLAAKADVIDGFMSFSPSALDDHPEVQTNPVLLYQIRIEKEQVSTPLPTERKPFSARPSAHRLLSNASSRHFPFCFSCASPSGARRCSLSCTPSART